MLIKIRFPNTIVKGLRTINLILDSFQVFILANWNLFNGCGFLEGKRTRLKGTDDTRSSQQGASVKETQKVQSIGEGISTESGTQKSENANVRKPSQAKSKILKYSQTLIRPLDRGFFVLS